METKLLYFLVLVLFSIGLFAVFAMKNLIKIIIGIAIMDYAINLFFVLLGYRKGGLAPIMDARINPLFFSRNAVDPLPQALVLTSIVIGLALTALLTAFVLRLYEKYGTFDISKIRRLKG